MGKCEECIKKDNQILCKEEENRELREIIEKSDQFTPADKLEFSSTNDVNNKTNRILQFEFSMKFETIQKYMVPLYKILGNNGDIWFSGTFDKITERVISSDLGRINQQQ